MTLNETKMKFLLKINSDGNIVGEMVPSYGLSVCCRWNQIASHFRAGIIQHSCMIVNVKAI